MNSFEIQIYMMISHWRSSMLITYCVVSDLLNNSIQARFDHRLIKYQYVGSLLFSLYRLVMTDLFLR